MSKSTVRLGRELETILPFGRLFALVIVQDAVLAEQQLQGAVE